MKREYLQEGKKDEMKAQAKECEIVDWSNFNFGW